VPASVPAPVLAAGRLLVATPVLRDPHFDRAVLLLLQHDEEDGALGVVLDRVTGTEVDEVLPGWGAVAAGPGLVHEGGPVQREAAICLGRRRPGAPSSGAFSELEGSPGLGTVDLDSEPDELPVEAVRVFAGYAGWSPGQLESEVDEGAWWVLDSLPGDVLTPRPDLLRAQVLRRQGPPLAFAAVLPDDPSLN
jgi:putative transcriptional regulator